MMEFNLLKSRLLFFFGVILLISSCILNPQTPEDIQPARFDPDYETWFEKPTDPNITPEAEALFYRLLDLRGKGILLGHNESTSFGLSGGEWSESWWANPKDSKTPKLPNEERSDIKDVCGDYPAMLGWDMPYYDDVMKQHMVNAYLRGGVSLVGWHPNNFASEERTDSGSLVDAWSGKVSTDFDLILPDGKYHADFLAELDRRAKLFNSITVDKDGDGIEEKVPFIFKLYHEHNGSWFWWGNRKESNEKFIELWKMTVDYLRKKEVNQMLISYSPDVFASPVDFLARYPGSDYVDIIGHDNYRCFRSNNSSLARNSFRDLSLIGRAFGKPVGITETGQYVGGKITDDDFWSQNVLNPLIHSDLTKEVTFIIFWRNRSFGHYFMVYPEHKSAADFKLFYDHPHTWFQKEVTEFDLYKKR